DETRFGAKEAYAVFLFCACLDAQGPQHAFVSKHGVQTREFFHRHFAATECQGQAIEGFGFHAAHARSSQEIIKTRLVELCGDPNRRHVSAANESFLGGDWAKETAIKVLRSKWTEGCGSIAQHRPRV